MRIFYNYKKYSRSFLLVFTYFIFIQKKGKYKQW